MKIPFLLTTVLALTASAPFTSPALAKGREPDVTLRIAPEREAIYRHGAREIILEIEVAARPADTNTHTPKNLAIVIDRSGSMEGAKIEKARQAACVALDRLQEDDIFSLAMYDTTAEVVIPPQRAGSRDHRDDLKERINRIRPGGSTALYAGVQLGAKQLREFFNRERVNRVILLSDGLANVGPSSPRALSDLGRRLADDHLSVSTIGVGDDFNEDLMTALAEASHANYYYVKDAEKLPGIFAQELGASATRVAGNVRIRIEVPAGVRVRGVLGHPEIKCEEKLAELVVPELFGAEKRLFHLQCAVDDLAGEEHPLATVALAYEDSASKPQREPEQAAHVRFTEDEKVAEKSVHDAIARNVNVLQNRLAKEEAVRLADAGQAKEAAVVLEKRAQSNAAAPSAQQMSNWQEENRKLETWSRELQSNGGLSKSSRKGAQYDNYQDKYQKR